MAALASSPVAPCGLRRMLTRFCTRRVLGCARSPGRWGVRHQRSRASCDAMRRRAAAAWIIGRPRRSGMLNEPPDARSLRSWRSTWRCGAMCRIDWLGWSSRQAALRFPGRRFPGKAADMDLGRIGVGLRRGAHSRLPIDCISIFRTTRRCASATKPSTSRRSCGYRRRAPRREREMQRFKSAPQAQRFLSAHAFIYGRFRPRRHRTTARNYRAARAIAFKIWTEETCARNAA
jgi:hypothetical protein